MKKLFSIVLLVMLGSASFAANPVLPYDSAKDTWSVGYNGKEILAVKVQGENVYLIDTIADNSSIIVDYYPDEPCEKCPCRLQFRDETGKAYATIPKQGFGTGDPFRLPGKQFKQLIHNHKIYLYLSVKLDGWGGWRLLGIIQTKQ